MKTDVTLLAGGYSEPADCALRTYRFNPDSGETRLLCSMPVANASFAARGVDGTIYAVTEADTSNSRITAIRLNDDASACRVINCQPAEGNSPCYVAVSPDGHHVFTANYGDGTVSAFAVRGDGGLSPMVQQIRLTGSGPVARRQDCSRAHCVCFTPDRRYAIVTNLGADCVCTFALTGDSGRPLEESPTHVAKLQPGSGPRHIVFNARGDMAYLINEISDTVTVLEYSEGKLTPVQRVAADDADAHGAGDIALSADGLHLFASLRLKHEGIATFAVDSSTGLLRLLRHTPTGGHPRNLCVSRDGSTMYVACRDADAVEVYEISPSDGSLTLRGSITHSRAVFVSEL